MFSESEGSNRFISPRRVLMLRHLPRKQVKVQKSYPAIHALVGPSYHLPLCIAALC